MADYQEFLDSIDRAAYHEGEWQWEEDGYTVTRTYNYTAPGCHDSCGVLLYTKDGKLARIEGDPLDPYANGKLCMRCLDMIEMVESDHRLKYPMKRAGERGENKWERITWDEAIDMDSHVHQGRNRRQGPGPRVHPGGAWHGAQHQLAGAFHRRRVLPHRQRRAASTSPAGGATCRASAAPPAPWATTPSWTPPKRCPTATPTPNGRIPDVLVVWGNEPLKSNGDGYLGHWLNMCVQMGTKVISIDPVLTWWGARAEYWLQPHPGTDCCIALGAGSTSS